MMADTVMHCLLRFSTDVEVEVERQTLADDLLQVPPSSHASPLSTGGHSNKTWLAPIVEDVGEVQQFFSCDLLDIVQLELNSVRFEPELDC